MITVSALMPTFNRREFIPRSIACFLAQQCPADWNIDLIVLDDGPDPIKDLLPNNSRIRYFHELPRRNHGQKMNRCMELSQAEFAIVWDDDDFYASDRVFKQVQPLIDNPGLTVSGTSQLYYYLHGKQQAFRYVNLTELAWIRAIAFRRSALELRRFNEKPHGADFDLLNQIPRDQWCDLNDLTLLVSAIHPTNAAPKWLCDSFVPEPWEKVQAIAGGRL
jgi:glycosyltransferase involved in cell wall biosynthesis